MREDQMVAEPKGTGITKDVRMRWRTNEQGGRVVIQPSEVV